MQHPSVSDGYETILKKDKKLVDKTGNQINVIYPYRTKGGWSFDDAEVDLQGEPFVMGVGEIINSIVGKRKKFTAYISKDPIPNYSGHLRKATKAQMRKNSPLKEPIFYEGWYVLEGTEMLGWLCPATLKYFKDYPKNIYFRIE